MRILVYGDSNSWGYLDDGSGQRYENRWPVVMAGELAARGMPVELVEECLPGRTTSTDDAESPNGDPALLNGTGPLAAILLSQQPLADIILLLGTNGRSGTARDPRACMRRGRDRVCRRQRICHLLRSRPNSLDGRHA